MTVLGRIETVTYSRIERSKNDFPPSLPQSLSLPPPIYYCPLFTVPSQDPTRIQALIDPSPFPYDHYVPIHVRRRLSGLQPRGQQKPPLPVRIWPRSVSLPPLLRLGPPAGRRWEQACRQSCRQSCSGSVVRSSPSRGRQPRCLSRPPTPALDQDPTDASEHCEGGQFRIRNSRGCRGRSLRPPPPSSAPPGPGRIRACARGAPPLLPVPRGERRAGTQPGLGRQREPLGHMQRWEWRGHRCRAIDGRRRGASRGASRGLSLSQQRLRRASGTALPHQSCERRRRRRAVVHLHGGRRRRIPEHPLQRQDEQEPPPPQQQCTHGIGKVGWETGERAPSARPEAAEGQLAARPPPLHSPQAERQGPGSRTPYRDGNASSLGERRPRVRPYA